MKKWNTPEVIDVNISETASGLDLWGEERYAIGLITYIIGDNNRPNPNPNPNPNDDPSRDNGEETPVDNDEEIRLS